MVRRLPTYRQFGSRVLSARLTSFLHEMQNVRTNNSADAIHDLRVASRRFHAAAAVFLDCVPLPALTEAERRIRRIRKSAGSVRDGDVQIMFIESLLKKRRSRRYYQGLERLLLRLTQRREKMLKDVAASMHEFDKSRTAEGLKRSMIRHQRRPTGIRLLPLRRRAEDEIIRHRTLLFRYEQFVRQPTASAELHKMRIAAKRFRYVMEIFNPVYRGKLRPFIRLVRSIQDALGEMHDCDVWCAKMPDIIEKERKRTIRFLGDASSFSNIERGLMFLSAYAGTERMKHYRKFTAIWRAAGKRRAWTALTDLITSR